MGDEMKLRIVFNVGNQFKEVEIDCDRNSTLASLYSDVIDHFGNESQKEEFCQRLSAMDQG